MMSEADEDRVELDTARKAVQTAKLSAVKADVVMAEIQKSSSDIRSIVERNGYVDRFRAMLRGA